MATTTNYGWTTPNNSDPFKDGALAIRTLGNAIDSQLNTGLLAWTSYTPTLSQGTSTNISKTIVYAKYARLGKIVHANIRMIAAGTGQATAPVFVSLPITAASSAVPVGTVDFFDGNVTNYVGFAYAGSTTTVGLVTHNNGENYLGTNPSLGVAVNDIINLSICYEGV
jgi:hypothetical protein